MTYIDRFEGGDLRTRWTVVRGGEKIVFCMLSGYLGMRFIDKKSIQSLLIFLLLFITQIVESSRGGTLLTLVCFCVGAHAATGYSGKNIKPIIKLLFPILFIFLILYALNSETIMLLISNFGEVSKDESIRSRMADIALSLWSDNYLFGKGYIDLFELPEWEVFFLGNMRLPVHNLFIQYGLYIGFIGLFFYVLFLFLSSFNIYKIFILLKKHRDPVLFKVFVYSFCLLISFFYMFLFQSMDRITLQFSWAGLGYFYYYIRSYEEDLCS
jgi:hypothetical protein